MTEADAHKRLHLYIKNRGHTPVHITAHTVRLWWNILNTLVFDGKVLPPRHITLIQSEAVFAWALPGPYRVIDLHIQTVFHERTTFLTVLIHEMVHAWEYMVFGRMGHGKRFTEWTKTIEQLTPLVLRRRIRNHEHTRPRPIRRYSKRSVAHHGSQATDTTARVDIQTAISSI